MTTTTYHARGPDGGEFQTENPRVAEVASRAGFYVTAWTES